MIVFPAAARWALVVAGPILVFLLVSGAGRPTVPVHGPEDPAAARAVAALTGPEPATRDLPPDFPSVTGYRPVVGPSGPVDPRGACSSPVPLPAVLTRPCQAHDLGYDLLRYADHHGHPLGAWARTAVDARFARDGVAACAPSSACRAVARLAAVVVAVNTWRQGASVPVVESATPTLAGAAAAAALVAVQLLLGRVRILLPVVSPAVAR